jgi:hypothetical protein
MDVMPLNATPKSCYYFSIIYASCREVLRDKSVLKFMYKVRSVLNRVPTTRKIHSISITSIELLKPFNWIIAVCFENSRTQNSNWHNVDFLNATAGATQSYDCTSNG